MAETLKLCPFCGGEAKEFTGEDAAPHRWTVECDSCGAHVGSDTRHRARAKWDRRAERTCRVVVTDENPYGDECSKCGQPDIDGWNYCPSCGAQAGGEGAVMAGTHWRDRAADAALAVADRLQDACFRMTGQRDDDWNWRPTAAQADAVLTSMQLAASEARAVAEMVREHLSDKEEER